MYAGRDVTVVIPALNEAQSIACVIEGLAELRACPHCHQLINTNNPTRKNLSTDASQCPHMDCRAEIPVNPANANSLVDRIIVCDNGSTDETAACAADSGAIVAFEPERGYGAACLAALAVEVEKDIIVFVDGDHSVVSSELPDIISPLLNGADLVIGSRTLGTTERGALSIPQRFGNALATFLISKLWSANVTDLGPFRATTEQTLQDLQMSDRHFGWTVEMQVRALQENKTIIEVPVSTMKRIGKSKISGTVRGVIGAGHGILGTIFKLYLFGASQNVTPKLRSGEN